MKKLTIEILNACGDVYAATELAETYYSNYPSKPNRPVLESLPSSSRVAAYGKELEKYELEEQLYKRSKEEYQNQQNEVNTVLEQYLKEQSGLNSIPEKAQAKVWAKAWEDGHSSGYYSVYQALVELVDLFDY